MESSSNNDNNNNVLLLGKPRPSLSSFEVDVESYVYNETTNATFANVNALSPLYGDLMHPDAQSTWYLGYPAAKRSVKYAVHAIRYSTSPMVTVVVLMLVVAGVFLTFTLMALFFRRKHKDRTPLLLSQHQHQQQQQQYHNNTSSSVVTCSDRRVTFSTGCNHHRGYIHEYYEPGQVQHPCQGNGHHQQHCHDDGTQTTPSQQLIHHCDGTSSATRSKKDIEKEVFV